MCLKHKKSNELNIQNKKEILDSISKGVSLIVFDNRMLTISGLKRDEVAGGWRKLNNEKLHVHLIKYYQNNKIIEN